MTPPGGGDAVGVTVEGEVGDGAFEPEDRHPAGGAAVAGSRSAHVHFSTTSIEKLDFKYDALRPGSSLHRGRMSELSANPSVCPGGTTPSRARSRNAPSSSHPASDGGADTVASDRAKPSSWISGRGPGYTTIDRRVQSRGAPSISSDPPAARERA